MTEQAVVREEMMEDRGFDTPASLRPEVDGKKTHVDLPTFAGEIGKALGVETLREGPGDEKQFVHLQSRENIILSFQTSLFDDAGEQVPEEQRSKLQVFFPEEEKIGVKALRRFYETMKAAGVRRCILVMRGGLSPFAKQATTEIEKDYKFELFRERELLVNITRHELVPKHTKMSEAEKRALLRRYHLEERQLPRMQLGDPVAKYFGLQRGDCVRIERKSETAGRYITYRVCL